MAIITVSRQAYSNGDEIARKMADDLDYNLIDKDKIGAALADLGLAATEVERFDEKKPSIWDSLATQHTRFLHLMKAVIYDFARKNDTIILGRGAQILLKDIPGTLHLRIVAPMDVRLKRLVEDGGYDEKNGEKMLRQSDRNSSGYIQSFFGADWNDNDYYDLLINTKTISIEMAAGMITNAIHFTEFMSDAEERSSRLTALSLQQKAEAAIMAALRGNRIYVTVADVDEGILTLIGTADSEGVIDACEKAISKITGVREVRNEIALLKSVYG